jgi:ribosomal protein S21
MARVSRKGNESLDKMLRRFKRRCDDDNIMGDFRRTIGYEKPSEIRRRKLSDRKKVLKRVKEEYNFSF